MCEPLLIKAAKKQKGYQFAPLFDGVREMLAEADYVIGNLETPLAGEDAGYCKDFFSFNAPDEFASAIREAGIDFVTTANNHCLDRGSSGLRRTLSVLDRVGLKHCGTSLRKEERIGYADVGGIHIAIVTGTYGTNYSKKQVLIEQESDAYINLLRAQDAVPFYSGHIAKKEKRSLTHRLCRKALIIAKAPAWKRQQLQKVFGTGRTIPYADDFQNDVFPNRYTQQMLKDLEVARKNSDFVVFFPHMGGQFNIKPGEFSEYIVKTAAESGFCDVIAASHPHVVQKMEVVNRVPCFYSLGNFSMSPNSYYIPQNSDQDVGLAIHLYLEEGKLHSVSYTMLKIREQRKRIMRVLPFDCLKNPSQAEFGQAERVFEIIGHSSDRVFPLRHEYPIVLS